MFIGRHVLVPQYIVKYREQALVLKIFVSAICQNKISELGELNQALKNHDKMKDDAIAQLSDQVMTSIARMQ
jgi:hypothetical protein